MQCRIQFHDNALEDFSWSRLEDGNVIDSGVATLEKLKTVCADASQVVVFLPQKDILLTSAALPPNASKQQLNAVAYVVEDKLAGDIEDCFFAILPRQLEDLSVAVAVIDSTIMENCVQLFIQHNVNVWKILPQLYLYPWSAGDSELLASVSPSGEGFIVRYGQHSGLYCHAAVLPQVLLLLDSNKLVNQNRVDLYSDPEADLELPEGPVYNRLSGIDHLSQTDDFHACINLKQKQFKSSHQWLALLKQWKWPVAAILLLGIVFSANDIFNLWKQDRLYSQLVSQQQALLQQYAPELGTSEQPKKQLIQLLAENQSGQGQGGFLDLLLEYSQLQSAFKNITTNKILYQQAQLVVNLESKDLNSLESLRNQLQDSKFPSEIENVNINPDKTTGRLVMRVAE